MTDTSPGNSPVSLFVPVDHDVATPTALSRGPWDPGALHGGPVAALLAHVVEGLRADDVDWFVARLTVELERPVPMEPLRLHAEVTRPGRKVSIVEATITRADSGAVLARARALRIRTADVALPVHDPELAPLLEIEPPPPGPQHGRAQEVGPDDDIGFHNGGVEHRFLPGTGAMVGPSSTGSVSACRCSLTPC